MRAPGGARAAILFRLKGCLQKKHGKKKHVSRTDDRVEECRTDEKDHTNTESRARKIPPDRQLSTKRMYPIAAPLQLFDIYIAHKIVESVALARSYLAAYKKKKM